MHVPFGKLIKLQMQRELLLQICRDLLIITEYMGAATNFGQCMHAGNFKIPLFAPARTG